MKAIPKTEDTLLLRTDFADDSAWIELCAAIQEPVGEFQAYVTLLSDVGYDGATLEQIIPLATASGHLFVFVADQAALADREHPVLVVDLSREPGRSFRVIPSEAWGVENNLSIANMDFHEFADAVDDRGVFRGFPEAT